MTEITSETPTVVGEKTGPYSGRLAWDSDLHLHTDPEGHAVITEDGGVTWRYATASDQNHYDRYHQQHATIDGSDKKLLELQLEHGRVKAEEIMREEEPHHYVEEVPGGLMNHPDHISEKLTSHTEAGS